VISASYNPLHLPLRVDVLHLRAEAEAGSADDARDLTNKIGVFLAMFHSAEASVGSPGTDADVKTLFDSLQVHQDDTRAVLVATVPVGAFRKLAESPEPAPEPTPVPATPAARARVGKSR
jgi:hypothetical protein